MYKISKNFYEDLITISNGINLHRSFSPINTIEIKIISTPIGDYVSGIFNGKVCLLDLIQNGRTERILDKISTYYQANLCFKSSSPVLDELKNQLDSYFSKKRTQFTIPTVFCGTKFQISVWNSLKTIPYGETISYKEQAILLEKPNAVRSIANANSRNLISILIPCHRVIGSDGSLTGYAGGLSIKKALLELERGTLWMIKKCFIVD
ncbi:MAG: methylated-DNA--[protein]-cysteine S-methyltransferase [Neisseriaceae bacterium]|nr:MAG: methylated-DNA--[protein]-cysteine S-methyltransferase [Neisseriaceae bacterium]